jgi:hypothetical protein
MNKPHKPILMGITVLVFVLCNTCAGGPVSYKTEGPAFTGDGGKGKSIAIIAPRATGLASDQNYIPALVQGELVSNFASYSAISVLDRMRLDEQYAELLSGYYDDDAPESWDLGHLNPTGYIMGGTITKTGSGYTLQISITNSVDKTTVASYSGTVTASELDNLSGVRRASLDLMQKMGVAPTERTRISLSGAAVASEANAQKALSRGIAAQQGGNEFQAMFDFFEARTFNPNMQEASARTISAGTTLAANNWTDTGARNVVLSEIERMREETRLQSEREANIKSLLEKATAFYKAHQPFSVGMGNSFTYGNINAQRGTVDIGVTMNISPIVSEMEIIGDLMRQARSIGVKNWPMQIKGVGFLGIMFSGLGGNNGVEDYSGRDGLFNTVQGIWVSREILNKSGYGSIEQINDDPNFTIVVEIINNDGKALKRGAFNVTNFHNYSDKRDIVMRPPIAHFPARKSVMWGGGVGQAETLSFTIMANDLSDTLTMRIVSVNGKSIDSIKRSGYVGIAQESLVLTGQRR